jgi:hypothetical protein
VPGYSPIHSGTAACDTLSATSVATGQPPSALRDGEVLVDDGSPYVAG